MWPFRSRADVFADRYARVLAAAAQAEYVRRKGDRKLTTLEDLALIYEVAGDVILRPALSVHAIPLTDPPHGD